VGVIEYKKVNFRGRRVKIRKAVGDQNPESPNTIKTPDEVPKTRKTYRQKVAPVWGCHRETGKGEGRQSKIQRALCDIWGENGGEE